MLTTRMQDLQVKQGGEQAVQRQQPASSDGAAAAREHVSHLKATGLASP